jgi:hypothetical protein
MLRKLFDAFRLSHREAAYRAGATLSRFIAPDIRREVEIVDASEVEQGFVSARVRTWNVLYAVKGITPAPEFGEPERVRIDSLWHWEGARWGGPVPHEIPKP